MATFIRDVWLALRRLSCAPRLLLLGVLPLALAIGATMT